MQNLIILIHNHTCSGKRKFKKILFFGRYLLVDGALEPLAESFGTLAVHLLVGLDLGLAVSQPSGHVGVLGQVDDLGNLEAEREGK